MTDEPKKPESLEELQERLGPAVFEATAEALLKELDNKPTAAMIREAVEFLKENRITAAGHRKGRGKLESLANRLPFVDPQQNHG